MSTVPHILVVEDDAFIGMHIAEMLSDGGYTTTLVTSVAAAEAALTEHTFHAATLDFRIHGGDCLALVDSLNRRRIPFLFCTGSLEDEVHEVLPADVLVLTKPFDDAELLAAVARAADRSKADA